MLNLNLNLDLTLGTKYSHKPLTYAAINNMIGYPRAYPQQISMQDFAFDETVGVRLLLGSRDYGKTDYITILGTINKLYNCRHYSVLLIVKELSRGKNILSEIASGLKKLGVKLSKETATEIKIKDKNGKEPSCTVLSVRSQGLRGRHPNLILMDDVVVPTDTGEAERKRVQLMYEEAFKLTPNICLIGQPVHKLDLYQKLRKLIPTALYPYGSMPERDKYINLQAQALSGISNASIQASYYLNIIDDNSLPFSEIETVDTFNASETVMYIDPSHKGKDYTAIVCAGVFMQQLHIAGFAFKKPWNHCIDELLEIFKLYNVQCSAIETNGIGDIAVTELQRQGMPCTGVHNKIPKHRRIASVAIYVKDFKLHKLLNSSLSVANDIFNQQLIDYEITAKNDDAPDSLAGVLEFMGLVKINKFTH